MEPMLAAAAACPGPNGDQEPSNSPSSRADEIRCHWGPDSKQYFFSREQFDAACDFLCRVWDITELKREHSNVFSKVEIRFLFSQQDTARLYLLKAQSFFSITCSLAICICLVAYAQVTLRFEILY